jgi:hypothetical protein
VSRPARSLRSGLAWMLSSTTASENPESGPAGPGNIPRHRKPRLRRSREGISSSSWPHRIGESHCGHVTRARAALPRRTLNLVHWRCRKPTWINFSTSAFLSRQHLHGMSSIRYSLCCANSSRQSPWPRRKPQKPPARAAAPSPTSFRANTPSISTNAYVHEPARGQYTPMSVL